MKLLSVAKKPSLTAKRIYRKRVKNSPCSGKKINLVKLLQVV